MMMTRITRRAVRPGAFSFALLALFLMTGCDSGTETLQQLPTAEQGDQPPAAGATRAPARGTLTVTGKGFYVSQSGSSSYIYYAFTVQNTDTTRAFEGSQYQVSFFDAGGNAVASGSGFLTLVLPGETTAAANQESVVGTPTRMEVAVSAGRDQVATGLTPFQPIEGSCQADRFSAKALGTLRNHYAVDLKDVRAVAVLYDAQGNVAGGFFTFLNLVPQAGTIAVSVSLLAVPPMPPAKVLIYPTISNLTLLDLQNRPR